MASVLKRHPFPVEAFFRWSLVLTYAVPARTLRPLLGPGLELDTYGDFGFLAIALVQTESLRPKGVPKALGRDFFLSGYRLFARFERPGQQTLRGLRILRSDTDRRSMVTFGNLFTHYNYRLAKVTTVRDEGRLAVRLATEGREADLDVEADLRPGDAELPASSPFASMDDARKFVGPLPYTFDYEADSKQMIVVRGLRTAWAPRPVAVTVREASYLERPDLAAAGPRLANAFYVEQIPYAWKAGTLEAVP